MADTSRPTSPFHPGAAPLKPIDRSLFGDVKVELEAKLGRAEMTMDAVLKLKSGSIVPLDTGLDDLIGVYLNGALIARGEIVAVDESFAVRITEVAAAG